MVPRMRTQQQPTHDHSWQHDEGLGLPEEVHPLNDLRPHVIQGDRTATDRKPCWCKPVDDGYCIVHNALDGREEYEIGRRMLS